MADQKQYLGDGVYVEMELGQIKLTTPEGGEFGEPQEIYIEPEVLVDLVKYAKQQGWLQ